MLRTVVNVHHNKRLRCMSFGIDTKTPRAQRTSSDRCLNACAVRVVCRRVASFVRIYCIEWPVLSVAPSHGWSGANTRPPLNHPRFEPVLLFVQIHISSWISQLCDGHSRVRTVSPKLFVKSLWIFCYFSFLNGWCISVHIHTPFVYRLLHNPRFVF